MGRHHTRFSAEYGSSMGGWDRAKEEATAKATQFCERSGQQLALRDEQRSGSSFPGAPQKSTITFACVPDSSSTGEAAVATPPHATAEGLKKPAGRLLRRRQDGSQREA